ncbi:MAG: glycosyltransferase family 9 protein [Planctomycetota bacterium]
MLFGSAEGIEEGKQLESVCNGKALNLIGQTNLPQLFAFLQRMAIVLTNDSGPMHIAAALKIPVVAIFGPTNPKRTGPFLWANQKIFHATDRVPCAPCYKRYCPTQMECMSAISPQEVVDYLLKSLEHSYEIKKNEP